MHQMHSNNHVIIQFVIATYIYSCLKYCWNGYKRFINKNTCDIFWKDTFWLNSFVHYYKLPHVMHYNEKRAVHDNKNQI